MLTVLTNIFLGKSSRIHEYMDDILTTSSTWPKHMNNLKLLLETLRMNNLSCNPTKCEFAATEIEYLRYCTSEKGIKMSPKKLKLLRPYAHHRATRLCNVFWVCSIFGENLLGTLHSELLTCVSY